MRSIFLVFFCMNTVCADAQGKWKTIKPIKDTAFISELLVYHCECTGSRWLDIDSGHLKLPDSLQGKGAFTIDIAKDQAKKIFGNNNDKRWGYMYLVRGKVTKVLDRGEPQKAGPQYVPFFDIYEYKMVRDWLFLASSYVEWKNVDSLFQPLPPSVHIYYSDKSDWDDKRFRAYYLVADLKDKNLEFTVDTSKDRRLTPTQFYEENEHPLAVVNTTFFSFATNQNLNAVVKNGKLVGYNIHTVNGRGKDTFTYRHPFGSAIGIAKNREVDIAWLYTDSSLKRPYALQFCPDLEKDSTSVLRKETVLITQYSNAESSDVSESFREGKFSKWKMETAVGGGPVLVQENEVLIKNNEELKFAGKAIDDLHPRTAIGYTRDGKLIILVVEGRNKNAAGASLSQLAHIMRDLECWEALNLDGGGSSCLLVNGKETIKASDANGQRPVPAVFMIKKKK